MVRCRGLLTLQELLDSQTQDHLAAPLVVHHPSTCSVGLSIRGIPPVTDVASQNVRRTEKSTDGGPCQREEASVRETMRALHSHLLL